MQQMVFQRLREHCHHHQGSFAVLIVALMLLTASQRPAGIRTPELPRFLAAQLPPAMSGNTLALR
jgi:hypothetical protein